MHMSPIVSWVQAPSWFKGLAAGLTGRSSLAQPLGDGKILAEFFSKRRFFSLPHRNHDGWSRALVAFVPKQAV